MQPVAPEMFEFEDAGDSLEAIYAYYCEREWTDGLPIIPPTPERVEAMLTWTDRAPDEVIGRVPPLWGLATVRKIAVNAVMAGCRPEYLPVVIAAVEASLDDRFNLYGVQATTNPVAPLIIVNGPIRHELGFNCSYNCFGQGNRANATVGRAMRLVLNNIGRALPGRMDRAGQGQPAKYTFCVAENEEDSPWDPLHVERGHSRETSAVTVASAAGVLNMIDVSSPTADGLIKIMTGPLAYIGSNDILLPDGAPNIAFSPEHADILARGGFTKESLRDYIFTNCTRSPADFGPEYLETLRRIRTYLPWDDPNMRIPVARDKEEITLFVAGAPSGPHSLFMPSFGDARSVTRAITRKDGTPIRSIQELKQ